MKRLSPATMYILKGLIPYTEANLKLSFKPHAFFNELEQTSRLRNDVHLWTSRNALTQAYYRAKSSGFFFINTDGQPELTDLGRQSLSLYEPEKLIGSVLLVVFDIEERWRTKRTEFRSLLRMLKFTQVQKSVWVSNFDSRKILEDELGRLKIHESVVIYEARKLS